MGAGVAQRNPHAAGMTTNATSQTAMQAMAFAASVTAVMPGNRLPIAPQISRMKRTIQHMCAASGDGRTPNWRRRYQMVDPNMNSGAASTARPAPASARRGIASAAMPAMRIWAVMF
jgi:hypothetical protein